MKRPALLTMMLVPTLLTITVGLAGFGVYVERTESASRLADIDDELVRAETGRTVRQRPVGPSDPADPSAPSVPTDASSESVAPIDPVDPNASTPAASGDAVDPPVEFVLAADGTILGDPGTDQPFTAADLAKFVGRVGRFTAADGQYRVLASPLPDGAIAVTALPLDGYNAAVADFRRALLVGGLVVVVLEALVVWSLARAVSRPVVRMADAATRVADGELDTAVGTPSGSREMAQLAADLDRMLTRLRSTLATSETAAADARTARDQMERFLADVSHEFRTPLTALHGYSDLHAKGMLDDAALERAMRRMGSESARLNALVDDMLQLARTGAADAEPEVFDVAAIVGDVADDLGSVHPGRTIEHRIAPGTDGRVVGVPGQVHQALLNLGANACGHSGGDVLLTLAADATHVELSVVDHGPGIAEADRERVVLPFVRLDASRARDGSAGAGLGLALTTQIVASHQGTLRIDETEGGGATVTIRLPRAPQSPRGQSVSVTD